MPPGRGQSVIPTALGDLIRQLSLARFFTSPSGVPFFPSLTYDKRPNTFERVQTGFPLVLPPVDNTWGNEEITTITQEINARGKLS